MSRSSLLKLAASIAICQAAGVLGAFATVPAIPDWYAKLEKPFFNPPNWIFGPVWTVLYLLMGISLYLVWKNEKSSARDFALRIFVIQLCLNTAWSFLFFGLRSPWVAFADILYLCGAVVLTILSFRKISNPAALLLWPYLGWISFAAILNFAIALAN